MASLKADRHALQADADSTDAGLTKHEAGLGTVTVGLDIWVTCSMGPRSDRPLGPGGALVIGADERIARGRQN